MMILIAYPMPNLKMDTFLPMIVIVIIFKNTKIEGKEVLKIILVKGFIQFNYLNLPFSFSLFLGGGSSVSYVYTIIIFYLFI